MDERRALLDLAPADEVSGEIFAIQGQLLHQMHVNLHRLTALADAAVLPGLEAEAAERSRRQEAAADVARWKELRLQKVRAAKTRWGGLSGMPSEADLQEIEWNAAELVDDLVEGARDPGNPETAESTCAISLVCFLLATGNGFPPFEFPVAVRARR